MKLFQGYPDSVQDVGRGDQGLKLTPTGLMCPEFRVSGLPWIFQASSGAELCALNSDMVLRLFLDFPILLSSRAVCREFRQF